MAFAAFNQTNCEVCVIETGLGGRLDSTNVIEPEISIITNIGLDHTAFLGDTLEEIAFEKAGIIKKNTPVVIGEWNEKTLPVFEKVVAEKNAELILAKKVNGYQTDLGGTFQQINISTVISAIEILNKSGWNFNSRKN
jgi:dihydrofolate synthase/folylpolyglutamate synthase